jgi:hypothetical protein
VLTHVFQSELELELRLQQFIELARHGDIDKLLDAIGHARKHLAGDQSSKFGLLRILSSSHTRCVSRTVEVIVTSS